MKNIENEMPDITKLAINTAPNAKINEIENEIPYIINLANNTALTAIENKIPSHSYLVKKP